MSKPVELGIGLICQSRLSMVATVAASAVGWLLALSGLIGTIYVLPAVGWPEWIWVAAMCVAPPPALWLTRRAISSWRIRVAVPPSLLEQRCHGRLEVITDSDRRALRPIASTAYEVAARTGEMLAELSAIPGVRIFRGVRAAGADLPLIPHAISAGRQLVLIESVAWPPGHYETTANGRIYCDGIYIGQSVRQFVAAAEHWRKILPKWHQVTAMIVVHCCGDGIWLPTASASDLTWTLAEDAAGAIRRYLPGGRRDTSRNLLAALISATADAAARDQDVPSGEWR